MSMTIQLPADLETAVQQEAIRLGITPESLVEETLRQWLANGKSPLPVSEPTLKPSDDWERRLLAIARPCGVALSNEALSSEGLYD
jgi:hypothetical protein